MAERTWWVPWLLGVAAAVVAVLLLTGALDGEPTPEERIQDRQAELPSSTHVVVYEVTGTGKSPEIRYVVDGSAGTEKVEGVDLPWRKEVEITVGPGVGIAQLLAANSEGDSISCSVSVDGQVVNQGVARGAHSNVACSAVVRPTTGE
ncbi:MmpS family transport accessory protein [Actinokineospora soli]|uniref:MmpS family transport accessory protein n=1 Tax=Actinokineospora soli TaxID=1048753 RepID=A0ABW2TL59_9PSEU